MRLRSTLFSIRQPLGVGALVLGLTVSGLAHAHDSPAQGGNGHSTLSIILDRLNGLQAKMNKLSRKLRGVTQNWDKKLDSTNGKANGCNSTRFTCLWPDGDGNPTAVRDNETGLVWERSPDIAGGPFDNGERNWGEAINHCLQREVGGRKGWALPHVEQLATLVDTSNNNLALPTGHPFLDVQPDWYRSATVRPFDFRENGSVNFGNGDIDHRGKFSGIANDFTWCARGAQVFDGQDNDLLDGKLDRLLNIH